MSDVLEKICADKRKHIAVCRARVSDDEIITRATENPDKPRDFIKALEDQLANHRYGLIAEIKKASPSKGLIRADFDPKALAQAYQAAGASCLSVLTDVPYFQGDDRYLQQARGAVDLPVLRKDFMLDPYQVYEARALGADCILLIMAALTDKEAQELEAIALQLGMAVLIEVHNQEELDRSLLLSSPMIGINNRNLKTLQVDLATAEYLSPRIPPDRLVVCESGLSEPSDLARMADIGVGCFLIGESLMRQKDVASATTALLANPKPLQLRA